VTVNRALNLNSEDWKDFDPKGRLAGPIEYPDDLTGTVQWLRTYLEGPVPVENGSVGLSICHMAGTATDWLEHTDRSESEVIILLEGSASAQSLGGDIQEFYAPCVLWLPRGDSGRFRYTSDYRGVFVLLW